MWWKRAAITTLIAASSLLVAVQPAGAAIGAFGPPITVVPSCNDPLADASAGADGRVRGFSNCNSISGGALTYFRYQSGAVTRHASPYTGHVRAVAWDGVNSLYVVYVQGASLKLGKYVETTGTYSPPTVLSTHSGVLTFSADIVASHGKWWAVWSEQVGPGGEFAQTELFQRRTLNGSLGKTQITRTAANVDDSNPSLAYYNGTLSIVWTRTTNPNLPGPSIIRYATTTGGAFSASTFAPGGDGSNSIAVVGGRTYVSWQRGLTVWEKDNATGPWTTKQFATRGFNSSLAVSSNRVFVSWTSTSGGNQRVIVAERTGTTWSGATVTGSTALSLALVAVGGKARTIYTPGYQISLRAQN